MKISFINLPYDCAIRNADIHIENKCREVSTDTFVTSFKDEGISVEMKPDNSETCE